MMMTRTAMSTSASRSVGRSQWRRHDTIEAAPRRNGSRASTMLHFLERVRDCFVLWMKRLLFHSSPLINASHLVRLLWLRRKPAPIAGGILAWAVMKLWSESGCCTHTPVDAEESAAAASCRTCSWFLVGPRLGPGFRLDSCEDLLSISPKMWMIHEQSHLIILRRVREQNHKSSKLESPSTELRYVTRSWAYRSSFLEKKLDLALSSCILPIESSIQHLPLGATTKKSTLLSEIQYRKLGIRTLLSPSSS